MTDTTRHIKILGSFEIIPKYFYKIIHIQYELIKKLCMNLN
jgi:hypothetical protein